MTSCRHPHQMPWSGATGAIARCKRVSTGCGRKSRSVRVLRWICGVKLKPKAVNKPLPYFIVHELDKPGSSATVSLKTRNLSLHHCSDAEPLSSHAPTNIATLMGSQFHVPDVESSLSSIMRSALQA